MRARERVLRSIVFNASRVREGIGEFWERVVEMRAREASRRAWVEWVREPRGRVRERCNAILMETFG